MKDYYYVVIVTGADVRLDGPYIREDAIEARQEHSEADDSCSTRLLKVEISKLGFPTLTL